MKKLVISAALAFVSLTMSAQDIYQFSNVSKPKTYKLTKEAAMTTPVHPSQDSLVAVQRAFTLQQLATVNPTAPIHLGAEYLRKSAHFDNLALGLAGGAAVTAIVGATMDDADNQKPFWYVSGLFALSGIASKIISINYKLRASQLFSSVTITPTTVKLTF